MKTYQVITNDFRKVRFIEGKSKAQIIRAVLKDHDKVRQIYLHSNTADGVHCIVEMDGDEYIQRKTYSN